MNAAYAAAIAAGMLSKPPKPYMLIDGNWLKQEVLSFAKRFFDVHALPIDWFQPFGDAKKSFYFDALPTKKPNQTEADYQTSYSLKIAELERISSFPDYHVRNGLAFHRAKRGLEQKGVDILLAIQALSVAYRGVSPNIVLVLGDLDFLPLIDELVTMGISVELWHSATTSKELIRAADRSMLLGPYNYIPFLTSLGVQLPEQDQVSTDHSGPSNSFSMKDGRQAIVYEIDGIHQLRILQPGHPVDAVYRHPNLTTLMHFGYEVVGIQPQGGDY